MLQELHKEIQLLADPDKGLFLQKFFKTGPGEYAEGDVMFGLSVPQSRKLAKKYNELSLSEVKELLCSEIHEERLIALLILIGKYKNGSEIQKKDIFDLYLNSTKYINNWDLVDTSAGSIVGGYLADKDKTILEKLARSDNLWERRIAIIATFHFIIHEKSSEWTFKIAEILVHDSHDLIHKAVGWMLREVGKRVSRKAEETFLKKHYKTMPRTMLRYAIEHFPPELRAFYMKK